MGNPWNTKSNRGAPAQDGIDLYAAKSDTVDLTTYALAFYVGTTGDVKIMTPVGTTLTFKNVPAGTIMPWGVRRLFSTGTTVTDCIGAV
jgi:hypothetical protein